MVERVPPVPELSDPPGSAEDRLRGLLAANRSVVSELALPGVLRRIVEAARAVAGAGTPRSGCIGADGRLEQFIHSGMDNGTVSGSATCPPDAGCSVRSSRTPADPAAAISDDPRSVGFPPGHPPMQGFLGVPVRSRGEVFGNLYLAERLDGADFTADDEDLVVALAASAGVAIENARLYEESRRRQEWLRASAEISRDLLRPGLGDEVLVRIADAVLRLADADVVTLDFPAEADPALRPTLPHPLRTMPSGSSSRSPVVRARTPSSGRHTPRVPRWRARRCASDGPCSPTRPDAQSRH